MNNTPDVKLLSSLVKVFPEQEPVYQSENAVLTGLKNEKVSFQVAYRYPKRELLWITPEVKSPISDYISIRSVENVPVLYPSHPHRNDGNYLRKTPGLYPDRLQNLNDNRVLPVATAWESLWFDIEIPKDAAAGTYPISVILKKEDGTNSSIDTSFTIYDAVLPEQTLVHTEWFHADCLANYYETEVFSEKHWTIIENFVASAVKNGCNMILTPLFTPPLDTAIGGERTTVQLIDITVENKEYRFDFSNLKRWIDTCNRAGIQYYEMSHLFTQWGATAAPKIMANIDGNPTQIFGWDTPAVGGEYTIFLRTFLPQLINKLKEWDIADKTMFHISDEPLVEHMSSYRAARESIVDLLKDFTIIDALSDFEFYKTGLVPHPISANDHIEPFLEAGVEGLWTYYCTSQALDVSNRFISMPSQRNRILGVQLYKYNIEGFLHWGYNFYNTGHSLAPLNPYVSTDAGGAFPAGDPFLVYPGKNGTPEESIRQVVLYHALSDLRALQYLESLTNREYVMDLIERDLASPITFSNYPTSDSYSLQLRNAVNAAIAEHVKD